MLGWLRDPEFLARVGEGVLSTEEQRLLLKSWSGSTPAPQTTDLSIEDIPLLDELRYALGDVPQKADDERDDPMALIEGAVDIQELMTAADREYAPTGRAWTPPTHSVEDDGFAHVLIDEAQDLTPMQWRMVGRRGRAASWTIVGDLAQSSWPAPDEAAAARASVLEGKPVHEFHLSTNYRNSAEIYDFAAAYAGRVGLGADLPDAVRRTGVAPTDVTGVADLESATREAVVGTAGQVAGTVGIVVPAARRSDVNAWLASWPELADDARGARAAIDSSVPPSGDDRVVVLTGLDTKGLEFDGIVVVSPDEIEAESATGRATLYVVLTRATQLLTTRELTVRATLPRAGASSAATTRRFTWSDGCRSSLRKMLVHTVSTVFPARKSSAAIAALDRPSGDQPEHLELPPGETIQPPPRHRAMTVSEMVIVT